MPRRERSITGQLLLPAGTGTVRVAPGRVCIANGKIRSVEEGVAVPGDLGGPDWLITPGFVDAHLHLPQFDSIGQGGLELLDWLAGVIFPAEARWSDAAYAEAMTRRVGEQLRAFGTTAFAAYATVHHEGAARAIRTLGEMGFCGCVGQVLMDRNAPPELVRPAAELLEQAAELPTVGRVTPAVTPRFAVSCTPELLRGAGELARRTLWPVQTHLAETRRECEVVHELFGGASYVDVYERAGLLTDRAILAHGIWLTPQERRRLAERRCVIAHCPTANRFLHAGAMDLAATTGDGVGVALGSDVAGGPDRSMVRVARAMLETALQLGRTPPSPARAWWQITSGNAGALGLKNTGSLAPGLDADVLAIEPDIPWRTAPDPLGTLLYGWDDRWLKHTFLAGAS